MTESLMTRTRRELVDHLKRELNCPETDHVHAEELLLEMLRANGDEELADAWEKASSRWWYA